MRAAVAGATFRDGTLVRDIDLSDRERISLRIGDDEAVAGALIGADGANGVVASAAGLTPVIDPPIALEANCLYAGEDAPANWQGVLGLELGSMEGGYGWSFPKADHFNVGCGGWSSEGPRLRDHLAALRRHGAARRPRSC